MKQLSLIKKSVFSVFKEDGIEPKKLNYLKGGDGDGDGDQTGDGPWTT